MRARPSFIRQPGVAQITLACAVLVFSVSPVLADTLYGVGPGAPSGPFVADASTGGMVIVGTTDDPIDITIDPTGPAWDKDFTINRDGQGWFPGQTVTVNEVIRFLPTTENSALPADWHEVIDTSTGDGGNFVWGTGSILVLAPTPGTFPGSISSDGGSISFDFPQLPIPSEISITKTLVWTGGVITPGPNGTNDYHVHVTERPSPEPSTLALAGIGLSGMLAWRWRKR